MSADAPVSDGMKISLGVERAILRHGRVRLLSGAARARLQNAPRGEPGSAALQRLVTRAIPQRDPLRQSLSDTLRREHDRHHTAPRSNGA